MTRPKCSSRRTDGQPCGNWPIKGGTVCGSHGGKAPQVKAKARERIAEQQARAELARLNLPPVDDPLSMLASVAAEVVAWKDAMAVKVNALTSLRYGTEGGEQLRAEVALWERALDRCERFLTAMARLNIDERLAAISEARAEMIITMLAAALERTVPEHADAVLTAFDEEFARQAGVRL